MGKACPPCSFGKPPMSLAHVILGLLQQQERTGYDLKTECFDDCISHLWPADQAVPLRFSTIALIARFTKLPKPVKQR